MAKSSDPRRDIDLDEVRRMLDALERDLANVQGGSGDVQALRDAADRLRDLLASGHHHSVRESLHTLRLALEERGVTLGQYVTMIGRILGL
jgi:hypothetical protein